MLIQLPVETWIEILDWLRRRDLLKKLDKLWDREFTPIVQDWLHKYTRKIKIGRLLAKNNGLNIFSCGCGQWEKVPFAEVELPGNITSFKRITIRHFDSTLLALLRRMRPLLRNIYLDVYYANEASTHTALHHLVPMIGEQIGSIELNSNWLQFFFDNFRDALFNAKLLCVWSYSSVESEQLLINWLFTQREDGQPRTLVYRAWEAIDDFNTKLRERFLDPARQSTNPFFIRFDEDEDSGELLLIPSIYENVRTGEQLTVRKVEHGTKHFGLITNCSMNADGKWCEKKTAELLDLDEQNQLRTISLDFPTIGPIEVENEQHELIDDHNH